MSSHLYAFGGDDFSTVSQLVISTGKWKNISRIPTRRSFFSGAILGQKVYLCGGHTGVEIMNTLEAYDCSANTWTELSPMPEGRYWSAAAALNGLIYVSGGKDKDDNSLSTVVRYDPQTDRWSSVSPMTGGRSNHQLVELGGFLYAIGGHNNDTVERYEPVGDTWVPVAWTRSPHSFFGAVAHRNRIYICSDSGTEVYSPELDQWSGLPALNRYRGRKLAVVGEKLWAVGGGRTDSVFQYNLADDDNDGWKEMPDMDTARENFCLFSV